MSPEPQPTDIAILEDDPVMGASLLQRLELEGYRATWWRSGAEALQALRRQPARLMVCDLRLPDLDGEQVFRTATREGIAPPTLFITAYAEIDHAVRLMRAGAGDYLAKPFAMRDFLERVDSLLQRGGTEGRGEAGALGASPAMRQLETLLRRVADIDSTLLLHGETGVGKEVAARFLHAVSNRAAAPFMAVNCAAIPADLLESELFGHERGAFTGAQARHLGYAERAGQGVLFLDEVAELSPALQAKLLRLLQERRFTRVGGETALPCKARLLCASNADLESRVREGRFRADLLYRINVIPLTIPPLRERPEDVTLLLHRFTEEFARELQRPVTGISSLAEEAALAHDWPGNVRELRNRIERAVALALQPLLGPADLFPEQGGAASTDAAMASLAEVREAAEARQIRRALQSTGGQMSKAAEALGISRTTLWEKMRRLGLGEG